MIRPGRGPAAARERCEQRALATARPIVGMTRSITPVRRGRGVCGAARDAARSSRNGPIASASTGAEPKHSSASRGLSTIGRPAVLSDVLTTTGTPVRRSTASSMRGDERFFARGRPSARAPCRRRARRRRAVASSSGFTRVHEQHVRRRQRAVEHLRRAFGERHRRDRAELLAAFHVVQPAQRVGVARIREQRAVAERARAVFAAALEPRDDAVVGDHARHRFRDVARARVAARSPSSSACSNLRVAPAAAERRARASAARRRPARFADVERRAERGAGVARGRLHPDVRRTARVRATYGVRDARSARRRPPSPAPFIPVRACSQRASVEHRLLRARLARSPRGRRALARTARPPARGGTNRAKSIGSATKPPSPSWCIASRISRQPARRAVRRERHDLVLVGAAHEADVHRELFVAQAERVRQRDAPQRLELAVARDAARDTTSARRGRPSPSRRNRDTARRDTPTPRARRGAARNAPSRGRARAAASARNPGAALHEVRAQRFVLVVVQLRRRRRARARDRTSTRPRRARPDVRQRTASAQRAALLRQFPRRERNARLCRACDA